jgi:hypothetical protein
MNYDTLLHSHLTELTLVCTLADRPHGGSSFHRETLS